MVNKRGLSEIVTTLIMVLLGIVIVGVIWAVVNGLVGNAKKQVEVNTVCQGITLLINYASCTTAGGCTITVKKEAGTSPIAGVRMAAEGPQGATVVYEFPGDIPLGTTKSLSMTANNFTTFGNALNVGQLEAIPYVNMTGVNSICTNGVTTTIIQKS